MKKLLVILSVSTFILVGCLQNKSKISSLEGSLSIQSFLGEYSKCEYISDVSISQSTQRATSQAYRTSGGVLIAGNWTLCFSKEKLESAGFSCSTDSYSSNARIDKVTSVNIPYNGTYSVIRVVPSPEQSGYNSGYSEALNSSGLQSITISGRSTHVNQGSSSIIFETNDPTTSYTCVKSNSGEGTSAEGGIPAEGGSSYGSGYEGGIPAEGGQQYNY